MNEQSPLMNTPGAVSLDVGEPQGAQGENPDPDAAVAWHYGDPIREQRLLTQGGAVTDLSHRGMLVVTGEDRLAWLHSLTSQHLSGLEPGRSVEALILSPHGHVEHALHLTDDGERTWLSVEPGAAQAVSEFLRSMRFRKKVAVEDVSADWAMLGAVLAPGAPAPQWAVPVDGATHPPSWQDPWPAVGPDSGAYTTMPLDDHPGWARPWREIVVPRSELALRLAEVPLAGSWASEALRIAAYRPRQGRENDARLLPHEADWIRTGVHLEKGCYRGQETVARVYHLGRPPRRLVMLHLDGSEHAVPALGAPISLRTAPEGSVGQLTSAALHYELGPIALGVIKRNTPPEADLLVQGIAAAQEVIVSPDIERGRS